MQKFCGLLAGLKKFEYISGPKIQIFPIQQPDPLTHLKHSDNLYQRTMNDSEHECYWYRVISKICSKLRWRTFTELFQTNFEKNLPGSMYVHCKWRRSRRKEKIIHNQSRSTKIRPGLVCTVEPSELLMTILIKSFWRRSSYARIVVKS